MTVRWNVSISSQQSHDDVCEEVSLRPKFSVILPVCHGGKFLAHALATLADVSAPQDGFEVIIAGNKPEMNDPAVFTFNRMQSRTVDCEGNRSVILNAACAAARGSIWVFADDDCIFPGDWLLNIEHALIAHPEAVVLGGVEFLPHGAGVFDLALDEALNSFAGTGGVRGGRGVRAGRYYPKLWNMTVLAAAAKKATLDGQDQCLIFDPSLCVHEDVDLVQRIEACGGKVAYVPEVMVGHYRDTNFVSFFKRNMCMARICRRLGINRGAHLALVALMIGFPTMGVASLVVEELKGFFLAALGVYTAVVILTGSKGAVKKKRAVLAGVIPGLIVALHVAKAAGYILPFSVKENYNP